MRYAAGLIAVSFAGYVSATLPPQTDEAKAQAAEAAAKGAWSDKVALYQLCLATDRTAEAYRSGLLAEGKDVPPPVETAPCVDPGPYASQITPIASKPLEAATAHSPPGPATSPPSTNAPAAEISAGAKE
jgi:hypothetical protein